jgi:hypothetical protein
MKFGRRGHRAVAVCATVALALGAAGGDAGAKKPTCKKKQEQKGCVLSKDFAFYGGKPPHMTVVGLGKARFAVTQTGGPASCSSGAQAGKQKDISGLAVEIHQKPVVGKSYSVSGSNTGGSATLTGTLTFTSAKKAAVDLTYTELQSDGTTVDCVVVHKAKLKRTQ